MMLLTKEIKSKLPKRGDLPLVERDKFFGFKHTLAEAQEKRI